MERNAIDQLHGVVLEAVVFTDAIDWDDVGMMQTGSGFRFTSKSGVVFAVSGDLVTDDFESDVAV